MTGKKAKISAIFKKCSKLHPGNYRPISVLPVISKLLERIVHTQPYTYLNDTGLLTAEQSGFRKNHSTQTSLHKLLENFYSDIENGKNIGMLALNLPKAFDTVNHKILQNKLKHYGISEICLNWFRSYLESRTQMACINGSVSDPLIITTGVPQGSILGPLLFTIYMVPKCLLHCKTNMYADDTVICVSASDKAGVTQLMEDDLINVNDWLCANRLSLYIGKTSCMLVTSAQRRRRMSHDHLDLSLNDNQIEHVKASPYVGITIDQNLNFNIQTNNICKKANRALGALKRAAPFLPIDTRALMFNTMVLSHLDYCSTIWGATSDTNIGKLQKIQNRGMRIILQCHPRTHIADMLSNLKWLSIKQKNIFLTAVLVFKIMHSKTLNYMAHWLVPVSHQYGTRRSTSGDLFVPRSHPNSLTTKGTRLWNQLPASIRTFPNLKTFKKATAFFIAHNFNIY